AAGGGGRGPGGRRGGRRRAGAARPRRRRPGPGRRRRRRAAHRARRVVNAWLPRYRAIAAEIAGKIRAGEYRPGDALPAQRELSARYGVTLMTLRQALRSLQEDGLVVQQAGRGTFVAPAHAAYRLDTLRSLADDLREQGHRVSTEVLARDLRRPPARVAKRLGGAA